jgi:hypothetical protein
MNTYRLSHALLRLSSAKPSHREMIFLPFLKIAGCKGYEENRLACAEIFSLR